MKVMGAKSRGLLNLLSVPPDRLNLQQSGTLRIIRRTIMFEQTLWFRELILIRLFARDRLASAMFVYDVKTLHAPYQHKGDLLVTKDFPLSSISILFNHVLRSWITRYRGTAQERRSVISIAISIVNPHFTKMKNSRGIIYAVEKHGNPVRQPSSICVARQFFERLNFCRCISSGRSWRKKVGGSKFAQIGRNNNVWTAARGRDTDREPKAIFAHPDDDNNVLTDRRRI